MQISYINFKKNITLIFVMIFCSVLNSQAQHKSSGYSDSSGVFYIPYVSSDTLNNPTLVLVLHGDAPFNNPSYQYLIAKKIANDNNNTVAVGVLRPGYKDNEGNQSKGERGEATGDNYTIEVLKSIHNLITELKKKYAPSKIILVGHSGGAAISANLISKYPDIYSKALLISCPCDLHAWRKHMKKLQSDAPIWNVKVRSLSPIEELKKINDSTQVVVIHGDNDKIVPISIATEYVNQLEENNKKVSFVILENQGHEIALHKKIFEIIKEMIE